MTDTAPEILYLSDTWLAEADRRLAGLTPVDGDLEVGVTVRGGPEGERRYRLVLGPDRVGIVPGNDGAGVRMTLDWEVAVRIANGDASAQRAFLDGDVQLGGDTVQLLGHQKQLADIDDRLAELRATTRYR